MYLFLLEGTYYEEWLGLFGSAFALKFLQVAHMVASQCTVDIFFIDWEKPKGAVGMKSDGTKKENPVSIWRTYFAANEWNEIQTCRKINHIFQIFAVVFFLSYVGFENVATKDPNGQVVKSSSDYRAPYDPMFRYAVGALVYLLVGKYGDLNILYPPKTVLPSIGQSVSIDTLSFAIYYDGYTCMLQT